ncbi:MAG TPA: LysM peptidoglycan-binding domain-containing protein [Actinomycetota bacterium]|jgi:LysM repeat protein
MAIRVEELERIGGLEEAGAVPPEGARVYRFPVEATWSRAERRRAAIVRRRTMARRRLAAGLTIVVVSIAMLFAGGPSSIAPAGRSHSPRAVVVQPGDTLWALADRYAGPGVDPRAYVDAVMALNGLDAPPPAGARIRLPR